MYGKVHLKTVTSTIPDVISPVFNFVTFYNKGDFYLSQEQAYSDVLLQKMTAQSSLKKRKSVWNVATCGGCFFPHFLLNGFVWWKRSPADKRWSAISYFRR